MHFHILNGKRELSVNERKRRICSYLLLPFLEKKNKLQFELSQKMALKNLRKKFNFILPKCELKDSLKVPFQEIRE
jgi:hypothetical protein